MQRRLTLLSLTTLLAGCALPVGNSGQGTPCWPNCVKRKEPPPDDTIPITGWLTTRFDRSVRPAADNLIERLRRDKNDSQIKGWIDEFIQPGQSVVSKYFDAPTTVDWQPDLGAGTILVYLNQPDWRTANRADAFYGRMSMLSAITTPTALRWKVRSTTEIILASDSEVKYLISMDLQIHAQRAGTSEWVPAPRREFLLSQPGPATDLFDLLSKSYTEFFRSRYGLKVDIGL